MKYLLITALLVLFTHHVSAQHHDGKIDRDKLKTLKVAHITEQVSFTQQEAQAFWPLYNTYEAQRNTLHEASKERKKENLEGISEIAAKKYLNTLLKIEDDYYSNQKEYYAKLESVLSAKKIIKVIQANRSFRKKMIDEFKERHKKEVKK
ncbi:hypothetical protein ES677_00450 [Bizionia gelidisalsuginis]|uniref:Sensor of ECF-type sigma factor n=2 Tax=Bizionia TaxID=283785 RepID=A0A8H2LIC8_9FLAO|nr:MULTISPECIES: hypothetical protein [Bizionia]TYB77438.1 hypothetical protein ES676_03860 [Bizionia saleffrena]TYC17881.1 hypothetical protein ES677_00450 [Bizionia gelidisalsuginis]